MSMVRFTWTASRPWPDSSRMISSSNRRADPLGALALDGDLVAPHGDVHVVEGPLDQPQQLVALTEQAGHEMVAGNEDLDLGACHVRSGRDPTSGSEARSGRPPVGAARPRSRPAQPGGQSERAAAEHVEMEVGHRVERVGAHVEHQPVAAVLAADALVVGHRLGRHDHGGHVGGVAGGHRRQRWRCAAWARPARARAPAG